MLLLLFGCFYFDFDFYLYFCVFPLCGDSYLLYLDLLLLLLLLILSFSLSLFTLFLLTYFVHIYACNYNDRLFIMLLIDVFFVAVFVDGLFLLLRMLLLSSTTLGYKRSLLNGYNLLFITYCS